MRRIFTVCFIISALFAASFNSFGQCAATVYTFNTGTSIQGFTTSNIGTGTFAPLVVVTNELRSAATASSTNTFSIISPTLSTINLSDPINFIFTFGNGSQATVTSAKYAIRYVDATNTVLQTTPVTYAGNSCISVPKPTGMVGNNYQIAAVFTVTAGTGSISNSYIALDNFGTNGILASVVLPVKFSALDAELQSTSVSLKWGVATEDNVTRYEIQKSIDGHEYSNIGFVNATGQTSYSFVDSRPSTTAYYRIKSVDVNGRYTYSSIAMVKEGKSTIVLKAFPSPFTKNVSVQHGTAGAGSLITVSSEDGRLIKSIVPIVGTQKTEIDLSTANAGLYLIRFNNGSGGTETLKILKQ
jgi:hypothetical protein